MLCVQVVFSPKGWEIIAWGNAPGFRCKSTGSLKGCDTGALSQAYSLENQSLFQPRALPQAKLSQPFGLKTKHL